MGLLLWMATRVHHQQPPVEPVTEGELRPADEFLAIVEKYWLILQARAEDTLQRDGITQIWLEQSASKI